MHVQEAQLEHMVFSVSSSHLQPALHALALA